MAEETEGRFENFWSMPLDELQRRTLQIWQWVDIDELLPTNDELKTSEDDIY